MANTQNLAEVYSADEMKVVVYKWNSTDSKWEGNKVKFKRNVTPDLPDNTRRVYNDRKFDGVKYTRAENSFTLEAEFQGYDKGLYPLANEPGLVIGVFIEPYVADTPIDNVRYYWNWNPGKPQWSAGDEGAMNVTLEGAIDDEYKELPIDNTFEA